MSTRLKVETLRAQGLTYDEIVGALGITKSAVAWHASESNRETARKFRRNNRKKFLRELKLMFGGKCAYCGYSRSLKALQFHHRDASEKLQHKQTYGVGALANFVNQQTAIEEAKKCDLVCANCHAEAHDEDLRGVAQSVEHRLDKAVAGGSSPLTTTIL